ncbi:hypothetical protein [Candidatus Amarobacter glycogenicus]|uniref:hypothetical protein n=1 Tax=Candidatus Amarobacter glycogenicus TaxID=3140699 RepID=UPI002A16EF35|nr:hypothetical protein [Dehalococcoidia bacterium]
MAGETSELPEEVPPQLPRAMDSSEARGYSALHLRGVGTEKDSLEDVDIEGKGPEAEETELAARLEESHKRDVGE